jgi:hypothetical protein
LIDSDSATFVETRVFPVGSDQTGRREMRGPGSVGEIIRILNTDGFRQAIVVGIKINEGRVTAT